MKVSKKDLLSSLPPEWPEDLLPQIQAQILAKGTKVVVLDDDPTGTQTVHDVPVFTDWSLQTLADMLAEPGHIAYILTNSRSLPPAQAQAVNLEIGTNLRLASRQIGRHFVVISRSDSTLRGHYPGEVAALAEGLGQKFAAILIVPFFLEGGRFTINNVHYVAEGDFLIPVAETEYARDAVFGYHHSNLRDWVAERHGGRIRPESVACISLEDLRCGGPEKVAAILYGLEDGQVCIVNAAAYRDLEVLVAGLLTVEAQGRSFISYCGLLCARARRPTAFARSSTVAGTSRQHWRTHRCRLLYPKEHRPDPGCPILAWCSGARSTGSPAPRSDRPAGRNSTPDCCC